MNKKVAIAILLVLYVNSIRSHQLLSNGVEEKANSEQFSGEFHHNQNRIFYVIF